MAAFIKSQKQERWYFVLAYTLFFILIILLIPTTQKAYFPIIEEELDWPLVVTIVLMVLYPLVCFMRYGSVHPAIRLIAAPIAALPAIALLILGVHEVTGRLPFENYYWVARFNWFLVYMTCMFSTWFFYEGLTSPPPQHAD